MHFENLPTTGSKTAHLGGLGPSGCLLHLEPERPSSSWFSPPKEGRKGQGKTAESKSLKNNRVQRKIGQLAGDSKFKYGN
jgi:hypothetical protein